MAFANDYYQTSGPVMAQPAAGEPVPIAPRVRAQASGSVSQSASGSVSVEGEGRPDLWLIALAALTFLVWYWRDAGD